MAKLKENPYYMSDEISNSALALINPEQGGSPMLFNAVSKGEMEKKEHLSLERGKLVHLFALQPDDFVVADITRPSPGIAAVIEKLAELSPIEGFCEKTLLDAARKSGFQPRWGDDAVLKSVNTPETKAYFEHLITPDEYVILTSQEKFVIESAIKSIKNHPYANYLIFGNEWDGIEGYNELPIKSYSATHDILIKGLLDRVAIIHDKKQIIIPDLKTTSKSVSNFKDSYEFWRYYRQHAFYGKLVRDFWKDLIDKGYEVYYKSVVVNITPTGLFETRVFDISVPWIIKGIEEYHSLLGRIAFHRKVGWEFAMEDWIEYEQTGKLQFTI